MGWGGGGGGGVGGGGRAAGTGNRKGTNKNTVTRGILPTGVRGDARGAEGGRPPTPTHRQEVPDEEAGGVKTKRTIV